MVVDVSTVQNDVITASSGKAYMTIGTERYEIGYLLSINIDWEVDAPAINCVGMTVEAYKAVLIRYSGSAEMYYNSSRIRKKIYEFQQTGTPFYLTLTIQNEDKTSNRGQQIIILNNVLLTKGSLSKLSSESEFLKETIEFKGTTFEQKEAFKEFSGVL